MDAQPPRSNLRPARRLPVIVTAVALAAAGAVALLQLLHPGDAPPSAATASAPQPQPDPAAAASVAPAQLAVEGPPLRAEEARGALERVSANPLFRSWLAAGDLVRRWVVVTDGLAAGVSPRRALAELAPRGPFTATARGDRLVISAESYARYDAFADAVASVDAGLAASVYRRLHGVLGAAYHALGMPAGGLDAATARALRRLADAPVRDGDVEVVARDGGYEFADPRLEALGDVEKHLLRMGPRNARLVQAKARALLEQLQLPVVATHRP